jgi:hypothetical protein
VAIERAESGHYRFIEELQPGDTVVKVPFRNGDDYRQLLDHDSPSMVARHKRARAAMAATPDWLPGDLAAASARTAEDRRISAPALPAELLGKLARIHRGIEAGFRDGVGRNINANFDDILGPDAPFAGGRRVAPLSGYFERGHAVCNEISLVACELARREGLEAELVGGSIGVPSGEGGMRAFNHAYVVIRHGEARDAVIYDPHNPVPYRADGGKGELMTVPYMASVRGADYDGWKKDVIAGKPISLIRTQEAVAGSERLYGVFKDSWGNSPVKDNHVTLDNAAAPPWNPVSQLLSNLGQWRYGRAKKATPSTPVNDQREPERRLPGPGPR